MDASSSAPETTPSRTTFERGQGMVEYAVILVVVAVLLLISVAVIGHQTTNMFSNVSNGLNSH